MGTTITLECCFLYRIVDLLFNQIISAPFAQLYASPGYQKKGLWNVYLPLVVLREGYGTVVSMSHSF